MQYKISSYITYFLVDQEGEKKIEVICSKNTNLSWVFLEQKYD